MDFDLPDFVGDFADVGGPSGRVPGQPEARQRPMGRFGVPVGFLGRTARGARVALPVLVYALTFGLGSWAAHLIVFRRTRAWRHAAAAAFHLVTVAVACVLIPTDGGFYALMWIMFVNYIGGGVVLGGQLYPAPGRAPAPADAHIAAPPLEPWTREWIRLRVSLWWQALLILPFGFGTALALLFAGVLARQPGWWALIPLHAAAAVGAVALMTLGDSDGNVIAFLGGLALGTAFWFIGALQAIALSPHYLLRRRAILA